MLDNDEEITDIETDEWYLRRLSSGLHQLQNADTVLAWLCMEYDGVSRTRPIFISGRLLSDDGAIYSCRQCCMPRCCWNVEERV